METVIWFVAIVLQEYASPGKLFGSFGYTLKCMNVIASSN